MSPTQRRRVKQAGAALSAAVTAGTLALAALAWKDDRQDARREDRRAIEAERRENQRLLAPGATVDGLRLGAFVARGRDLAGLRARAVDAEHAVLDGATADSADLDGADLDGLSAVGARLVGAGLTAAHLRNAHLQRADLSGATLHRADLTGADLRRAELAGAELAGAELGGANLAGTDLSAVKGLQAATFTGGACYDAATRWPAGSSPPPLDCADWPDG
ncbi:MAG: pentapeptide repeat-containing protein [Acidimicrobiales bacterium]